MDLELDIGKLARGHRGKPLRLVSEGELTAADIESLATAPARHSVPAIGQGETRLKRLRERHHALARLIASGTSSRAAAFATGYSYDTVRVLVTDPAFKELVAHYTEDRDAAMADLFERMSGLSIDAVDELRHRIEEEPEGFTNTQLLELLKGVADRTGHAPVQKSQNLHVHANLADRLAEARKRLKEVGDGT